MRDHVWIVEPIVKMLGNTLRLNFCCLKITHILHPRYHPKIVGHILKVSKRTDVHVFMRLNDSHNENKDENE